MAGKQRNVRKGGVILLAIIFSAVVLTGVLYSAMNLKDGRTEESAIGFLVSLLLGIFAVKFVRDREESVRKGIPLEDERSERIKQKAGYYAFLVSLYLLIAIGYYSDLSLEYPGLPAIRDISQATGIAIAGIALVFGVCWWRFSRKGDAG